ncbi:MAG: selenocysteine synthase [Alphaproteobacteria bacterium]|nr:selenocysteine synthase [Alphaproteobacteria bacterium]
MSTRRRSFLGGAAGLPSFLAALAGGPAAAAVPKRDLLAELKVRPFINAAGTYTTHSGSLMRPEVMEAINYASRYFVEVEELHNAVGKRIAELVGSESAMVTAGAASALTLATAGVLTGTDRQKINQIPDLAGMKNEVIVQKAHRFPYDHGIRDTGVKLVEVTTRAELEGAVNEKTAMLFFLNYANNHGAIKDAEFVEIGKKVRIPTFNDCAADVHPVENVTKWIRMGFDLVCFSGGKALMAPQSSGLRLGRADLIAGARANNSPTSATIGRGMKVNKEEMLGILVALESFLSRDHDKEWREWERRANVIVAAANSVPGVTAEMYLPEIFNRWPHIRVSWDEAKTGIARADVVRKLRAGEPSIFILSTEHGLDLGAITLRPGEERIVARRLKQELQAV